jgi:hypothetical protein
MRRPCLKGLTSEEVSYILSGSVGRITKRWRRGAFAALYAWFPQLTGLL